MKLGRSRCWDRARAAGRVSLQPLGSTVTCRMVTSSICPEFADAWPRFSKHRHPFETTVRCISEDLASVMCFAANASFANSPAAKCIAKSQAGEGRADKHNTMSTLMINDDAQHGLSPQASTTNRTAQMEGDSCLCCAFTVFEPVSYPTAKAANAHTAMLAVSCEAVL